jgi:hypothetical protein
VEGRREPAQLEDTMDDLENPNADEALAGADAPQDPVQAAKDEAWLAQFRADNAAAVARHNFEAANQEMAEATAAGAEKTYDLQRAAYADKTATDARAEAAEDERKAKEDAARHDEWELQRQRALHLAETADDAAGKFRTAADAADKRSVALSSEAVEIHGIYKQHQDEYDIIQEQAVAAQRIATDEAKLSHSGDPAPGEPGGESHTP